MNRLPTLPLDQLLPRRAQPYAKGWVTLIGVALSTVATYWPGAPDWVAIAGAVATTVAVTLTPNGDEESPHDVPPGA